VQAKETQIRDLKGQLTEKNNEKNRFVTEIHGLNAKMADVQTQVAKQQAASEEFSAEVESLKAEREKIANDLAKANEEIRNLVNDVRN